jgi:hypothetical protein
MATSSSTVFLHGFKFQEIHDLVQCFTTGKVQILRSREETFKKVLAELKIDLLDENSNPIETEEAITDEPNPDLGLAKLEDGQVTFLPYIPTILGTIKTEHLDTEKAFSSDIAGPSGTNLETPVLEYGTSPKKRKAKAGSLSTKLKAESGSLPKKQKAKLVSPTQAVQNVMPSPDNFFKLPGGGVQCLVCQKSFSRQDNAKVHFMKTHQEPQNIECPLCRAYSAKNTYDWNDHAKKVHQMSANDMKNIEIIHSPIDKSDAILAKRPDGKVVCLKCVDEQGCHKTMSRMDNAKLHFKKVHGPV